jgi:diguanylate cyclase (GGDEF)-like protein
LGVTNAGGYMSNTFIYLTVAAVVFLVVIGIFIKIIKKKNARLKNAETEIELYKNRAMDTEKNTILSKILSVFMEKDELPRACEKLVRILISYFKIDYCSLFLADERQDFRIVATNIRDIQDRQLLEEYTNKEIKKLRENQEALAYSSPNSALEYTFAKERGIRYYFLIPLKVNDKNIGCLVIENCNCNPRDCFEEDFFNLVVENTAVIVQKFIYDDLIVSMAMKDGLTQIYNRAYIIKHINSEIQKHNITGDRFTIVMFDIDHFKKFNDTYGHLFGDEVLKHLARYFQKNIRGTDYIARYGGEEFIMFFPHADNSTIYTKLDNLRIELSKLPVTMEVDGEMKTAYVTASFGMSEFPGDGITVSKLIENADKALYYSKENGRNRVTIYRNI